MKSAFEAYALSLFGHTLLRSLVLKREQAVGKVGIFFAAPETRNIQLYLLHCFQQFFIAEISWLICGGEPGYVPVSCKMD